MYILYEIMFEKGNFKRLFQYLPVIYAMIKIHDFKLYKKNFRIYANKHFGNILTNIHTE